MFMRSAALKAAFAVPALALFAVVATTPAAAQQPGAHFEQIRMGSATQTGVDTPLEVHGFEYIAHFALNPGHGLTGASLIVPGPFGARSVDMTLLDNSLFVFRSSSFADPDALEAAFPEGPYAIEAGGPSTTVEFTVPQLTEVYPGDFPRLTGTTFTDLQGMDTTLPFEFRVTPLPLLAQADRQSVQLFVDDKDTGETAFSGPMAAGDVSTVTMPAHLLQPGRTYVWSLYHGNSVDADHPDLLSGISASYVFMTQGEFVTAVPEPATFVLACAGLVLVAGRLRARAGA